MTATPYHCRYCGAKRVCSDPRAKCPDCRAIADAARVERERDYKRDWMRAARDRRCASQEMSEPTVYDDAIREIAGMSRRWPCVECRKPKTAVRAETRCPNCRVKHELNRSRAKCDALKSCRKASKPTPTVPVVDPAVTLYRAERAARDARKAEETYWTDAAIGAARELLLADATPGGPRVRRDGTERKTHYNSTFARGAA